MSEGKNIKVCIVTISLAKGGAERSTALLSRMLDAKNFDVHIVTLTNEIDYEYSGTLFNLGELKDQNNSSKQRFKRFRMLRKYLVEHNFDYIIDSRNRKFPFKEWLYNSLVYPGFKVIYVVRSFKISQYLPKKRWVAKRMVSSAYKLVGVSEKITETVNSMYKTDKTITIYNPVEPITEQPADTPDFEYILSLGRLRNDIKNFDLLLESYKKSDLPKQGIQLIILGDGEDKSYIEDQIEKLDLTNIVQLRGFTANVAPYLKQAKFLTLTSRYEGFPRVLIEALSLGTPVVSVDCDSGPKEVITNEQNGLLVENFNPTALSEAMNRFIFDESLYNHCRSNAKESVLHLSMEKIAEQWAKLLTNE